MATEIIPRNDLTRGGILKKLLIIAIPVMGSQLMQMAYNLTDMFWLGKVGMNAVAASGSAGMFMWLSQGFLIVGRMGAEIGVSQSSGKKDMKTAEKYASCSMQISIILGILFSLVMFLFKSPLIGFFGFVENEVVELAEIYLGIVSISIPFTFLNGAIVGIFNGSGNSRTPFHVNVAGVVLNIILDPFMIFTLEMGVAGAAIATVLSQIFVCLLMFAVLKKGGRRPFEKIKIIGPTDKKAVKQIFKWTIPISIESLLFTFLAMITSRIEAGFGAYAVSVSRVGSQIESLSWLIGGGFGSALTTFVGQNHGAGKPERIRKGVKVSSFLMAGWGFVVMLIMVFFGGRLFMLFLPEQELLPYAVSYLGILALCQIPMNLEGVSGGAFRGMGKTLPPSLVSIACNILRVILAYILSATSLGLYGVWWAISIAAIVRGLWSYIWYLFFARRQKNVDTI